MITGINDSIEVLGSGVLAGVSTVARDDATEVVKPPERPLYSLLVVITLGRKTWRLTAITPKSTSDKG